MITYGVDRGAFFINTVETAVTSHLGTVFAISRLFRCRYFLCKNNLKKEVHEMSSLICPNIFDSFTFMVKKILIGILHSRALATPSVIISRIIKICWSSIKFDYIFNDIKHWFYRPNSKPNPLNNENWLKIWFPLLLFNEIAKVMRTFLNVSLPHYVTLLQSNM